MRRSAIALLTSALLVIPVTASASGGESIKDEFDSISWGGSNGSLPWAGDWIEINDVSGPSNGNVRVVSDDNCPSKPCMRLSGLLAGHGARRGADTSQLEEIRLRYDVRNVVTLPVLGLTELAVEVNDGSGWATIATHNLGSNFAAGHTHEDIPSAANLEVRFVITGLAMTSQVSVDNVEITGQQIEESTTTTTTTTTTTSTTTTTTIPTTTTTTTPLTTTTTDLATPTTTRAGKPGNTSTTVATVAGAVATEETTTTTRSEEPRSENGEPLVESGAEDTDPSGTALDTPDGSGIRAAARGLQANFDGDLYGEVRAVSSLTAVDVQAEYNMAVEVIRASWGWIVLLALLVGYSIISGLDRHRGAIETDPTLPGN
ncbi:MAG TPA: hypothetical protein VLA91_12935 [Acidimicrobiia bacterium]|nr:hypothetical protein [Acidimicrobiia bacterium]